MGNARLTAMTGAAVFVALAAEGVTILGVRRLITAHVAIGMLLIPLVALKTATTTYRFARYYNGEPHYRRKGPPHPVLRVTGPGVVLTSVAVLVTGVWALAIGPSAHALVEAHKATFIVWFGFMTIHVLGHALETPPLAVADWRRARNGRVPGARARLVALVATLAIGVALAVLSLGWIGAWHQAGGG